MQIPPIGSPGQLPEGAQIEFLGDETLRASVLRALTGSTPADAAVDALEPPAGPPWLRVAVRGLRWYRTSPVFPWGQRCVFEPSCSRYAELALRQDGFFTGGRKTLGRLWRCRPGAGGTDFP